MDALSVGLAATLGGYGQGLGGLANQQWASARQAQAQRHQGQMATANMLGNLGSNVALGALQNQYRLGQIEAYGQNDIARAKLYNDAQMQRSALRLGVNLAGVPPEQYGEKIGKQLEFNRFRNLYAQGKLAPGMGPDMLQLQEQLQQAPINIQNPMQAQVQQRLQTTPPVSLPGVGPTPVPTGPPRRGAQGPQFSSLAMPTAPLTGAATGRVPKPTKVQRQALIGQALAEEAAKQQTVQQAQVVDGVLNEAANNMIVRRFSTPQKQRIKQWQEQVRNLRSAVSAKQLTPAEVEPKIRRLYGQMRNELLNPDFEIKPEPIPPLEQQVRRFTEDGYKYWQDPGTGKVTANKLEIAEGQGTPGTEAPPVNGVPYVYDKDGIPEPTPEAQQFDEYAEQYAKNNPQGLSESNDAYAERIRTGSVAYAKAMMAAKREFFLPEVVERPVVEPPIPTPLADTLAAMGPQEGGAPPMLPQFPPGLGPEGPPVQPAPAEIPQRAEQPVPKEDPRVQFLIREHNTLKAKKNLSKKERQRLNDLEGALAGYLG